MGTLKPSTYPKHPVALHEAISVRGTYFHPDMGPGPILLDFRNSREYGADADYWNLPDWANALEAKCQRRDITRAEWLKAWHDYRSYAHWAYGATPDNPKFNLDLIPKP